MQRLHDQSQYFLRNPRFVAGLIKRSSIKASDLVYDIGAGSGIISSQLAGVAGKVVAVELESRVADTLVRNMQAYDNVSVVKGDALTVQLPSEPYKVFANIPFHISSKIVRRFVDAVNPPTDAYLIVQKQFANKLLPESDGFSSQLGMQIGVLFDISITKRLRRTDYWPHPNVDTVLLRLRHREEPLVSRYNYSEYCAYIERVFMNPDFFKADYEKKRGVPPHLKASGLQLADWVQLFSSAAK